VVWSWFLTCLLDDDVSRGRILKTLCSFVEIGFGKGIRDLFPVGNILCWIFLVIL